MGLALVCTCLCFYVCVCLVVGSTIHVRVSLIVCI